MRENQPNDFCNAYFENESIHVMFEVPALPGCVAQGESMEELESNLHEAIEGWLLAAEPEDGAAGSSRILEVAV